ncbi:SIS domain-containing protein [Agriterribacter sp.]|uniref:SIS domain-containing protein n=1 Tax=Agriterribacter sp. TaxID=2821509 RepID=UPI002C70CD02|nr:SIS domain-containing protein [Agriterribacter sp.]HTN05728.1 SIS domain-containing protein [Agriterribacter sp.]
MEYIGMDADELLRLGAIHTAREISRQPAVWEKTEEAFGGEQSAIQQFLEDALTCSPKIILTGAGSSAYIGLSLKSAFQHSMQAEAIPTTDIVTHPADYFNAGQPVFIISFSGRVIAPKVPLHYS